MTDRAERARPTEEFAAIRSSLAALGAELAERRRAMRPEGAAPELQAVDPPVEHHAASGAEPAAPVEAALDPQPRPDDRAAPAAGEPPEIVEPVLPADPRADEPPWEAPRPAEGPPGRNRRAPAPPSRPRVPRRVLATLLVVILSTTLAGGIWRARQVVQDSQERVATLRQAVRPPAEQSQGAPSVAAPDAIRQVCAEAQALSRELGPMADLATMAGPAAQVVGRVPQVGDQAAGRLALASASGDTLAALREACEVLDPVVNAPATGTDVSALVAALGAGRDRLRGAAQRLRGAQGQLAAIDPRGLEGGERSIYEALRDKLPAAEGRLALLTELPGLLGYDGPRTFLVLGQNGDELRPTGGFIGTAGLLTFDRGRLVDRQYGSSFAWDLPTDRRVTPPEPLQRTMAAFYWQLKESNWMPDFPAAAQQARYFHELTRPDPIAGVVSVDQHVLELLLELTGPIQVPEYGETVTAANVRDRLEYHTHIVENDVENVRKGFVSKLFGALMDRLNDLPRERVGDLAATLEKALGAQSIQVWAADDRAQQVLANLGWDGRMLSSDGDYLYAVSANVGMNKINREVEQAVSYEVSAEPGGRLLGQATVALRNRRPTADPGPYPTADYLDYLRVYVPGGSELVSSSGFDGDVSAAPECGRTAFGGYVRVTPNGERQLRLAYRLPPRIRQQEYRLLVQKQPGLNPYPMTLSGFGGASVGSSVSAPLAFAWDGAALASRPWSPIGQDAPTRPACAVRADPPQALQPPREITLPKLDVKASFVELGVQPDGFLEAPKSGDVSGWYRDSARPGQVGNMVVSGHVDWDYKPAVFWRLNELRPGDTVVVTAQDGVRFRYAVDWSKSFDPVKAPLRDILGPTPQRWLTLITCGGTFNQITRQYTERLVVRARLVGTE